MPAISVRANFYHRRGNPEISACFGPADLFCAALSESIPAPTKTSHPSILRFHTDKSDIFPDRGFCLNYTGTNFNHKSAGVYDTRPGFFPLPPFIYSYKRATDLPHFCRGLSPSNFSAEERRYLAIGLAQIGRRINKAHTQRRESDRHSQRL